MGEMADDLIDGAACSWCGMYFEKEHGYPVVCDGCREGYSDKELAKLGLSAATEEIIG